MNDVLQNEDADLKGKKGSSAFFLKLEVIPIPRAMKMTQGLQFRWLLDCAQSLNEWFFVLILFHGAVCEATEELCHLYALSPSSALFVPELQRILFEIAACIFNGHSIAISHPYTKFKWEDENDPNACPFLAIASAVFGLWVGFLGFSSHRLIDRWSQVTEMVEDHWLRWFDRSIVRLQTDPSF